MNFKDIESLDKKNVMATYNRFDLAISSGKGSTWIDVDGKKYIDFGSGIGVNSLGIGDEDWVNAVSNQISKLQHISNLYYNEVSTTLAEKLCSITGFDKVFFTNSGAEANEGAIKLARKYSFDKYGENRNKIISLNQSFHGRTITTLSATGQDSFHNYFFPFTEGFVFANANDFDSLQKVYSENENKVCGIIIECIQGEGGVIPLELEFVKQVRNFCTENDIQLIIDEVQTGVGRTGKILCSEHYDLKADIVTLAKGLGNGLPIGAFMCNKNLSSVLDFGSHGTTFGGNPVACAGANIVLEKISDNAFLNSVTEKGNYITNKLKNMSGVKSIRGKGLMIGIELESKNSSDVAKKSIENGLIVLTAKTLLRLLPSLTISYLEIDEGLNILEGVLK